MTVTFWSFWGLVVGGGVGLEDEVEILYCPNIRDTFLYLKILNFYYICIQRILLDVLPFPERTTKNMSDVLKLELFYFLCCGSNEKYN